ncbi:MAG: LCP family protein [Dehalococcoidia bacterium]
MSSYPPPPNPLEPSPEVHRGRAWQRVLLIFAVAIFAAASLYVAFIVVTWADDIFFPGNEINVSFLGLDRLPGADSPPPAVGTIEDRINILVLGLDRRPWEPEDAPSRTDTVLVFTVEPFSGSAGVFSIPRDLLVEISNGRGGYFKGRVNVAYEYGTVMGHPDGRIGLAIDTIEHNFGIKIDYYIVADFLDFVSLIDDLGGVDVDVPSPLAAWYSLDDLAEHHVWMEFQPGLQLMDGERTLAYVRIRAGSSDLDRIQRQQQVVEAALKKALDVSLFLEAPSLWDKLQKAVETDIPALKVPGLALLAKEISLDSVVNVSLGDAVVDCTTPSGAQVLCSIPERVEELKRQVFFDPRLRSEGALIEVQNGTGQPGLATSVSRYLVQQGLLETDLVASDAVDGSYHAETLIFDLAGKRYTAEKLAEWLGMPKERILNSGDLSALGADTTADIIVILGADAQVSSG